MNMVLTWALWFFAAEAIVSLAAFLFRRKKTGPGRRAIIIAVKLLLTLVFALLPLIGPVQLRPAQPLLIGLYAALLAETAADVLYSLFCAAAKKERSFPKARLISLVLGLLVFAYGTVNMGSVRPCCHELRSEKLSGTHTVFFAADLHVGSAMSLEGLEKLVAAMEAEKPEAILLGGDITDDYTTRAETEEAFRLLGRAEVPIYYIYGNHDRQGYADHAIGLQYTEAELEQILRDNGIILLKDSFAALDGEVMLLGREDLSEKEKRADAAALVNPAPEKLLIVLDHQPTAFRDDPVTGAELQLSGHTHAGQFFPLRWVYTLFTYPVGEYERDGARMIVTAGAGGWRVPFRTEGHSCFEVIVLKP